MPSRKELLVYALVMVYIAGFAWYVPRENEFGPVAGFVLGVVFLPLRYLFAGLFWP